MDQLYERMDMGGHSSASSKPTCKISMLWNWYTIDSCFIARSWHVRSKGAFAGSCIGVFFLVVASQWLARFAKEHELAVAKRKATTNYDSSSSDSLEKNGDMVRMTPAASGSLFAPLAYALSHQWLFKPADSDLFNHTIKCLLFAVQWGLSYLIMLLFMYYNGYIIISCILGALVGKFVFSMNEPVYRQDEVSCCKE